ncbi:hypothetical protein [Nocardioides antri]|uniref:Uncharacterized protein n=1 Tax=Nocardioides antri TaxID=2607659 RepID=A0A5B1M3S6_9ACTN|nr:hypothetical protein [Nocardioides antri]KAA1427865.1 hypothetical protein F0U47_10620 [Nocardioides antri]
MPRRNRRQRQASRRPGAHVERAETPEEAALRLVCAGKCSPAILGRRRLPLRLPGGRLPSRTGTATGARDA